MCPACITTAALAVAGTTSGAGLIALVVGKWETLRRRLGRYPGDELREESRHGYDSEEEWLLRRHDEYRSR